MKKLFTLAIVATTTISVFGYAIATSSQTPKNGVEASTVSTVETQIVLSTKVEIVTGRYSVVFGDTLSSISQSVLGDAKLYTVVFDQNSEQLDATATAHGFANSESGHWIFAGTTLSISLPVISTEVSEVPTKVETATPEASPTESPKTETSTPVAPVTATATLTQETETVTNKTTSTPTFTQTPTSVATITSTPTVTTTARVVATPTENFTFSPTLPLVVLSGTNFYISTYFGEVTDQSPRGHRGVDIASSGRMSGFEIHAIENGKVVFAGWNVGGYGYEVSILHPNGLVSLYAHLSQPPAVSLNQTVVKGQVLGYMGNTGFSTGPHLHLEILNSSGDLLDPSTYLDFSTLNQQPQQSLTVVKTPVVVVKPLTELNLGVFSANFQRVHDELVWSAAVRRHQENLRQIWIWNSVVWENQRRFQEELQVVSFLLTPMVPKVETDLTVSIGERSTFPYQFDGVSVYVDYLQKAARFFGADSKMILATMGCENRSYDPNVDYIDSDGTRTAGIAQFKVGTYKSAATQMGLSPEEISDWTNPYNQLKVMAWKFSVGEAGAWTGYRNLVNLGSCRS